MYKLHKNSRFLTFYPDKKYLYQKISKNRCHKPNYTHNKTHLSAFAGRCVISIVFLFSGEWRPSPAALSAPPFSLSRLRNYKFQPAHFSKLSSLKRAEFREIFGAEESKAPPCDDNNPKRRENYGNR